MEKNLRQTVVEILDKTKWREIKGMVHGCGTDKERISAVLSRIKHAQPLYEVLDNVLGTVHMLKDRVDHPTIKAEADEILDKLRSITKRS